MAQMNRSALMILHSYNRFAGSLLFEAAAQLTPQQLTLPCSPSHGSVMGLLQHMLGTEIYFLLACQGKSMPTPPTVVPSLEQLRDFFSQVSDERECYLQNVTEEELQAEIDVQIGPGTVRLSRWQLLAQSILGSVHHRGELSIVMTGLGRPLPTMDAILQFVADSGQEWPSFNS